MFPLKLRVGLDVFGASKYFYDKEKANIEAFFSVDMNEKRSAIFIAGRSDYTYSLYIDETFKKYRFNSKGFYLKSGVDINMFKPKKADGKYSLGVGLRYGITNYSYGVPEINFENYWGSYQTSISKNRAWAHYIEATPSIRAEIFKNLNLGWSISLRKAISSGTGKGMKPIYMPGYGDVSKTFGFGINYFIIWSFPHKEKRVIIQPKVEDSDED
jgi:hypothetical protein